MTDTISTLKAQLLSRVARRHKSQMGKSPVGSERRRKSGQGTHCFPLRWRPPTKKGVPVGSWRKRTVCLPAGGKARCAPPTVDQGDTARLDSSSHLRTSARLNFGFSIYFSLLMEWGKL